MTTHWSLVFMVVCVVGLQLATSEPQTVWNGDADMDPNAFESLFNEDTQQLKPQKFDRNYRPQPSVIGYVHPKRQAAAAAKADTKVDPKADAAVKPALPVAPVAAAGGAAVNAAATAATAAAGSAATGNAAAAAGNSTGLATGVAPAEEAGSFLSVLQNSFLNIINYVRSQPENAAATPELNMLAQTLGTPNVALPAVEGNSSATNGQFFHIIQITNSSVYISNDVTRVGRSDQNDTLSSESNASVQSQTGVNAGPVKAGTASLAKGGLVPPVTGAAAPLAKTAAALPAKVAAALPAKGVAVPPAPALPAKRARRDVMNPKFMAFELLFNPNEAELIAPVEQFNVQKHFNKRLANGFDEPAQIDDFVSVTPKPTSAQADTKCQCPKMAEPSARQPDNAPVIFQPKNVNFFNILPMLVKDKKGEKVTRNTNIFQEKWEEMLDF